MNGVKLEHMCHYSVNLSLYRDCLLVSLSAPPFTDGSLQAANIPFNSYYLQIMSRFSAHVHKIQFLRLLEWSLWIYFKEMHEKKYASASDNKW